VSEIPEEIHISELEGSFKEERVGQGAALPPAQMPQIPHRGAPAEGDSYTDQHSSGTKPSAADPEEYVYGRPGERMKELRKLREASKSLVDTSSTAKHVTEITETPQSNPATPQKLSHAPSDIAVALYDNGISFYRFFISASLPRGTQWFFPTPRVLMVNTMDFIEVQRFLALKVSDLTGFKGDGFVGDPGTLYSDPTLGPMMAMSGMFHVEQEKVDDSLT
jgi:hypothetical protein